MFTAIIFVFIVRTFFLVSHQTKNPASISIDAGFFSIQFDAILYFLAATLRTFFTSAAVTTPPLFPQLLSTYVIAAAASSLV